MNDKTQIAILTGIIFGGNVWCWHWYNFRRYYWTFEYWYMEWCYYGYTDKPIP